MEFLTKQLIMISGSETMPEEWRKSALISIFKNNGDVPSCSNYRGLGLKLKLRQEVIICESWYGFMPRKSTTDAIFALRMLMKKYREGEKSCIVDLEKAYGRVLREELWFCMSKSAVEEKYVLLVQDMYESSMTVVSNSRSNSLSPSCLL